MKNILITGATGFLGKNLLDELSGIYNVSLVLRSPCNLNDNVKEFVVGDFSGLTNFSDALKGVNCVIHIAGLAHQLGLKSYSQFKPVNVDATKRLAEQAVSAGVERFIFVSSIGVNGVASNYPFKFDDVPSPVEPYALSKLNAEIELKRIASYSKMGVTIIRPPLIYGKGAPGNFSKLLKIAQSNFILPFGAIKNNRSFVSVYNIVDLIKTCINHPQAPNNIFLVSDGEDVSTTTFLKKLINYSGAKTKLLNFPTCLLSIFFFMIGKKSLYNRFSSSLTIDMAHTRKTLNWTPPYSLEKSIEKCTD